jgi:hypothetical protein
VVAVAVGSVGEVRGRRTNAARNTMSDWETAGRVLVEARVGPLCMGIMRLLGGLFLPQARRVRERVRRDSDGIVQRKNGDGRVTMGCEGWSL